MALWESLFFLSLFVQAGGASPPAVESFSIEEKARLAASIAINGRISIYNKASQRIQTDLQEAIHQDHFEIVPDILTAWSSLLQTSIADIETDGKSNKKSKELRKFEIRIRKDIKDLADMKLKAPYNQQDIFESCIAKAETIRKKIIDILFKN
jgi:hypothetical protein